MDATGRLYWTQINRSRRDRAESFGTLAKGIAERIARQEPLREKLRKALSGLQDQGFGEHCRVAGILDGRLLIQVNRPSLVYAMRQRWQRSLEQAIQANRLGGQIRAMEFEFGYE